ncbi:MAG: N-acetyltransferase [Rothia sp. (in: high G+C Gram-positive bacteria)]|uniref:GNAT family N-acetyltransferase n=1 Tax=Rothia sp. (in: high G+C Gram-positive bacteria) TaxID=1885016 RepID=UPI00270C95F2|nr:N-acetyltransferase [Rothia sp. (in: high G+C Gram-positive bacteria)]
MRTHTISPETPADTAEIRDVLLAAFDTSYEADLVEALRGNPNAWEPGISLTARDVTTGALVGYVLISRCWVGSWPAYALAPLAVHPDYQGRGVGTALTLEALARARASAQISNAPTSLLVLGEPTYYSCFDFVPAARHGVRAIIDGIDPAALAEALQLINLTPDFPPISGEVTWPAEYGLDQGDDL